MIDPTQTGGKALAEILHHVSNDSLVKRGWNPGDGRTLPPLTHEEFAKQMTIWIANGAVASE